MPTAHVRTSDGYVFCLNPTIATAGPGRAIVELNQAEYDEIATKLSQRNAGVFLNEGVVTTAPAPTPATASAGDFMKALVELDWYDLVEAAVNATDPQTTTGKLTRILWTRAALFERNNALVLQIAAAIGKTSEDLDDLFVLANSYNT